MDNPLSIPSAVALCPSCRGDLVAAQGPGGNWIGCCKAACRISVIDEDLPKESAKAMEKLLADWDWTDRRVDEWCRVEVFPHTPEN